MTPRARIALFWALVAATIAVYMTMIVWTLPTIAADAGAPAFDMRMNGYTVDEARAFLAAISPEAKALYTGPQRLLDLAYPTLLTLVLIWSVHWATRGLPRWVPLTVSAMAIMGGLCDYAENAVVARMLSLPLDQVSDGTIETANLFTLGKARLTIAAYVALLGLLVWRAVRRNV